MKLKIINTSIVKLLFNYSLDCIIQEFSENLSIYNGPNLKNT